MKLEMPVSRLEMSKEAKARVVELNSDNFGEQLKSIRNWKYNPAVDGYTKRLNFFVTDTGHICDSKDSQVAGKCTAVFSVVGEDAGCPYLDIQPVQLGESIDPVVMQMVEASVKTAAAQLEEFPSLLNL